MQKTFFKKIIPSMLIITILATGFFGVFRIGVVNAEEDNLFDKYLDEGKYQKIAIEKKPVNTQGTPGSGSSDNRPKLMTAGGGGEDAQKLYKEEQERQRLERERSNSATGCNIFWDFNPYKCLSTILASIAQAMLEFFGFFVWISGKLLNIATQRTVLEMGSSFQDSQGLGVVVKEAWKTIRDLSNIIIIFMLLMIGIGIILRLEKYGSKKLLGMLIAVAILINFSLFFTNVVIDTSNLLALQFYNKVSEDKPAKWNGISDSYMEAFGLSTWYSNTDYLDKDFSQTFTKNNGSIKNIFIIGILGSIMFLITSFAFLAATFFLISRYVILIFLMIFSPIAFVGMILPATKTYTTQWVNMLLKNAFYAPVYFLLTWFVISIITSPAYQASLGLLGSEKFANLTASETFSSGSIDLVLSFIIVIFFIILSIILSQQMGIKGSSMVISWGQSARKWGQGMVGRNTVGYAGYRARKGIEKGQERLELAEPKSRVGKILKNIGLKTTRGAKKVAYGTEGLKFQSAHSRRDVVETRDKDIMRDINERTGDTKQLAGYFTSLSPLQREKAYSEMSARNRAALDEELDNREFGGALALGASPRLTINKVSKPLRDKLSTEEKEKTIKEAKNAREDWEKRETRRIIDAIASGGSVPINPATTLPYTSRDIVQKLKVSEARKLSDTARLNPNIIHELTPRHLADLQREGDLTPAQVRAIMIEIYHPTTYANQADQQAFVSDAANKIYWT